MASPDVARIYALIRRVDELCLESSRIGAELANVAGNARPWPESPSVSRLVAKSHDPYDFFPTSTTAGGDK